MYFKERKQNETQKIENTRAYHRSQSILVDCPFQQATKISHTCLHFFTIFWFIKKLNIQDKHLLAFSDVSIGVFMKERVSQHWKIQLDRSVLILITSIYYVKQFVQQQGCVHMASKKHSILSSVCECLQSAIPRLHNCLSKNTEDYSIRIQIRNSYLVQHGYN